jgi:hypothetical protein
MAYFNIIKRENLDLASAVFEGSQYPYDTQKQALEALTNEFDSSDDTHLYLYTMRCDDEGVEIYKFHKRLNKILDATAEQHFQQNPEAYFVDDKGDVVRG